MSETRTIAIVSDIHYASQAEKDRRSHETRIIANPALRLLVKAFRRYFWLRDPFAHNGLLDEFISKAALADLVVANGDYSCDTAFVGVSDDAAFQSANWCLGKLRHQFPGHLAVTVGDHELGKMSLFGGRGGMRLASWSRTCNELAIKPFWRLEIGRYVLMGVTSSLVALPVFAPEALPDERPEWEKLRADHMAEINFAFAALAEDQKVLLFCHDPSALPFLWREDAVREKLSQVESTIIGHLHTGMILWKSRLLAGMPALTFLGNSVRRMSLALHEARHWKAFNIRLCPSLAGSELLKDGGFYTARLDPTGFEPAQFQFQPLARTPPG